MTTTPVQIALSTLRKSIIPAPSDQALSPKATLRLRFFWVFPRRREHGLRRRRFRLGLRRRRERGSRRPGDLSIEVEVRGRLSGDEPRAAVEGQVLDRPFHEDDEAALELDEVHDVDER